MFFVAWNCLISYCDGLYDPTSKCFIDMLKTSHTHKYPFITNIDKFIFMILIQFYTLKTYQRSKDERSNKKIAQLNILQKVMIGPPCL